jgi:hypothetical protein
MVVQAGVGVDAEELPDALDGEHLAVGQGRPGAALAQAQGLAGQPVVDQAEDGDQEGRKIHGRTLVGAGLRHHAAYEGLLTSQTRTPG